MASTIDSAKEKKNPITVERLADGTFVFDGRSMNITKDKNKALEPFGCILLQYGLKLFTLPTDAQAEQVRRTNGCSRVVANDYLDKRKALYSEKKETLTVSEYKANGLAELKKEKPFLKEVDKFALETAIEHIDDAYENYFKKKFGFPKNLSKYKPNGNRYTTKFTNNNIALVQGDDGKCYIKLPKLGLVRFVLPEKTQFQDLLPKGARITKATVIKDGRNYLVSLQIETIIDKHNPVTSFQPSEIIGMDMGIKEFAIYGSDMGERIHIRNARYIKVHEKKLRRAQQALARKKYDKKEHQGSKNYYKAKEKVAKEQRKIANQRKDMQHKLSRKIADSCRVFVCEDLNIKGMMKNRHLSKAIASVGWGQFLEMVKYKIERKGGLFIQVSRWFPSSKTCTHCGYKKEDLQLSDRYWICPECGALIDRDENAVDNIIKEGIKILAQSGIPLLVEMSA